MIDLNAVESINHISPTDINLERGIIDREVLLSLEDTIKNQYVEFNNLGQNLLKDIEFQYKDIILQNLLEVVTHNYTALINYDETLISINKRIEVGTLVYEFFCIDCYNIIMPNFLNTSNIQSIESFDQFFKRTLKNDVTNFKTHIVRVVKSVVDELTKLQLLDKKILKDVNYQLLLKKYAFYIELVNFGDTGDLLFNYFKPVLSKNFADILWRIT